MIRDRLSPENQAAYDRQWAHLDNLKKLAVASNDAALAKKCRQQLSTMHEYFSGMMLPEPPPQDSFEVLCESYEYSVLPCNQQIDDNGRRFIQWLMDNFELRKND